MTRSIKYFKKRIIIESPYDFGVIDSTFEYYVEQSIDMGTTEIEVPEGVTLNLKGSNIGLSGLSSSEDNYTMFKSTGSGMANIFIMDMFFSTSGTNSKVIDAEDLDGTHSFEVTRINFNDCTSVGKLNGFRQGLETGTGRFGGTPELELDGTWSGGYFIETSIARALTDGSYSIFKAGTTFTMASRFRSNQNVDLPASASFLDFIPSNFPNPSTLDLNECRITRNGIVDTTDSNITPNINEGNIASDWKSNQGIPNTHIGGQQTLTLEAPTVITGIGDYETLLGTWTVSDLQHFDDPLNGQLRHIGETPRNYKLIAFIPVVGNANDNITIRLTKWDDSASAFVTELEQTTTINNIPAADDTGTFHINDRIIMDKNDYIFYEIADNTSINNITAKLGSYSRVEEI